MYDVFRSASAPPTRSLLPEDFDLYGSGFGSTHLAMGLTHSLLPGPAPSPFAVGTEGNFLSFQGGGAFNSNFTLGPIASDSTKVGPIEGQFQGVSPFQGQSSDYLWNSNLALFENTSLLPNALVENCNLAKETTLVDKIQRDFPCTPSSLHEKQIASLGSTTTKPSGASNKIEPQLEKDSLLSTMLSSMDLLTEGKELNGVSLAHKPTASDVELPPGFDGIEPISPAFAAVPEKDFANAIPPAKPVDASARHNLLEEFKAHNVATGSSKSTPLNSPHLTRKFELSDIVGHVIEFSTDQHGSRFIQQKLEVASDEEKVRLFQELLPHCFTLMNDVFGNYVIQKFFDHGSDEQKAMLCNKLQGKVYSLSTQVYGCRVIQKALEHVSPDLQASIIHELDDHVLQCIRNQNGNHVIQKCIECVPPNLIQFIIDAFSGQVYSLATHPYGCRVIQRIFEHCTETQSRPILEELHRSTSSLILDQYGNYVIQHILEHGKPEDKALVLSKVKDKFLELSRHKFASNVVEKCVAFASNSDRNFLIKKCLKLEPDGSLPLLLMMKDQFANYVVQKMLDVVDDEHRELLLSNIRPHFGVLRRFTYGKHIINKVEQLSSTSTGSKK